MKIVDANVLLYAVNTDSSHHNVARRWLTEALQGIETIAMPWLSLLAFVRVSTNPRIFASPLSANQAMDLVQGWLDVPHVIALEPTQRHVGVLSGLLGRAGTAGNLTNDAHLAALAVEHGAAIVSFDRDFGRFDVPVVIPA